MSAPKLLLLLLLFLEYFLKSFMLNKLKPFQIASTHCIVYEVNLLLAVKKS